MSTNTNFVDVTIYMPMPLRSAPSFFVDALLNRKFTFRKFQTVKNLYQLLTAREKMVPVRHIFRTNISLCEKYARRQMS